MADSKDPKEKDEEDESEAQPDKGAEETPETIRGDRDKWKALARKHEAAAKANAAAAKKLQDLEEKDKSESDKMADRVTIAEKKAADAEREAARLRVGLRKGLTETQAKRLIGETEDELEADAKELLESFQPAGEEDGKEKSDKPGSGRPKERVRSGAAPDEEPDETDPRKLAAKVPRP